MYTTGRLCMKVAGRDAGQYCLVIGEKDGKILIDGNTRKRHVNPTHLEPLSQTAKISKGASHEEVLKALKDLGVAVKEPKKKPAKQTKKTK